MGETFNSIRIIVDKRPSFDSEDDIKLVVVRIENNIRVLSFKQIKILEKSLLVRLINSNELKAIAKRHFSRIGKNKSRVVQEIKIYKKLKDKEENEKKRREISQKVHPKSRRYQISQDNEATQRLIEANEEMYQREKRKWENGIKMYKSNEPLSTTWISNDELTPPPTEE